LRRTNSFILSKERYRESGKRVKEIKKNEGGTRSFFSRGLGEVKRRGAESLLK